jgi:hypothetical protein
MPERDLEVEALLDAADALLETLRRSLLQSERLRDRAVNGVPVTPAEEAGVHGEIERTRAISSRWTRC